MMRGQLAKNVVLFMSSPDKEERAFIQRTFKKKQELEKENDPPPQHTSAPGNVPSQEGSEWLDPPGPGGLYLLTFPHSDPLQVQLQVHLASRLFDPEVFRPAPGVPFPRATPLPL